MLSWLGSRTKRLRLEVHWNTDYFPVCGWHTYWVFGLWLLLPDLVSGCIWSEIYSLIPVCLFQGGHEWFYGYTCYTANLFTVPACLLPQMQNGFIWICCILKPLSHHRVPISYRVACDSRTRDRQCCDPYSTQSQDRNLLNSRVEDESRMVAQTPPVNLVETKSLQLLLCPESNNTRLVLKTSEVYLSTYIYDIILSMFVSIYVLQKCQIQTVLKVNLNLSHSRILIIPESWVQLNLTAPR